MVTVAMPVYNAGNQLRLAVLSIVRQTCTDWELLIVDDGSTDDALRKIDDIRDPRIRILCDGMNKGLAARLNECIELARGKYLARMDQDDVSYPDRLLRQVAALEQDPDLDLLAVRAITIDENNQMTGMFPSAYAHEDICARPWRGFHLPHPTWMGRTEWFRKYRYAVPAPYFCEDQELLLRSYRASRFATLDETLFAYRTRTCPDWKKLTLTRQALLAVQWHYFNSERHWHKTFLATAVYLARRASDVWRELSGKTMRSGTPGLAADEMIKWKNVREGLIAQAGSA